MEKVKKMSEFLNEGNSEQIDIKDLSKEIYDVLVMTSVEIPITLTHSSGGDIYLIRTSRWYFNKEDLKKIIECPSFYSMSKGGGYRQKGWITKYPDTPKPGKLEKDDSMILEFRV